MIAPAVAGAHSMEIGAEREALQTLRPVVHVVALIPRRTAHVEALRAASRVADSHHARLTLLFSPTGLGLSPWQERLARFMAPIARRREDDLEVAAAAAAVPSQAPVRVCPFGGSPARALLQLTHGDPCQLVVTPRTARTSLIAVGLVARLRRSALLVCGPAE